MKNICKRRCRFTLALILFIIPTRIVLSNIINTQNTQAQIVLSDTISTQATKTVRPVPLGISFVIADMKLQDNKLKILEMGEGPRSYFRGHELLYGTGLIWKRLWNYLEQFKVPVWYISKDPNTDKRRKRIACTQFEKIGGMFAKSFYELKRNPIFQELIKIKNTKQYIGIIVLRHLQMPKSVVKRFKKMYPQFLILDEIVGTYVNNKYKTSLIFEKANLQEFRPRWKTYPKKYSNLLSKKIINDFKNVDTFVIKPVNAANGWGISIIDKSELDLTLKTILTNKKLLRKNPDKSYNWWCKDKNNEFLVEEYVSSKVIKSNGKKYDGTMRIVFIMDYDENKIDINFIGGYWKLPAKSLDEDGTLTERHKSKVARGRLSSQIISKSDFKNVKIILRDIMPKLYASMINNG